VLHALRELDLLERGLGPFEPIFLRDAGIDQRELDVVQPVARGSRLNVWKTNPISSLRMRASSLSFIWLTCFSLSRYEPLVGVSRQPIRFINVDLPEPDGPMMATYSPRSIRIETPRRA